MKICLHCNDVLESEREQFIGVCWQCRRYALLLGTWPENDTAIDSMPEQDNSNESE